MLCQRAQRTHVILANVYALAANLDSDIDSVVDQQRHAILLRDPVQLACHGRGILPGRGFVAVLHDGDAAAERRLDDIG